MHLGYRYNTHSNMVWEEINPGISATQADVKKGIPANTHHVHWCKQLTLGEKIFGLLLIKLTGELRSY